MHFQTSHWILKKYVCKKMYNSYLASPTNSQKGITNEQTIASIQKYIHRMHKTREEKVN